MGTDIIRILHIKAQLLIQIKEGYLMGLKATGLRTIVISGALCMEIIVGSYGVNLALADNNDENTNSAPKYQVNESGQTYGSIT